MRGVLLFLGVVGLLGASACATDTSGGKPLGIGASSAANCDSSDCEDDDGWTSPTDDDDGSDPDSGGTDGPDGPDDGSTSGFDTLPDEGGDEGEPQTSGPVGESGDETGDFATGGVTGWGSSSGGYEGSTGGDIDPPPGDEVCFPGANGSGNTCFPLVQNDPYDYPSPPLSNNYREPIRYIDLEAVDLTEYIAPNFRLSEMCVPVKGRYQVAQPHAIEKLQATRNQAGALTIKSGFRSPPYNAQQPGAATNSRHMFGDAFDLVPSTVSQQGLYDICEGLGAGYIATYTSGHVHCDWRNVAVDPRFYGSAYVEEFDPGFAVEDLVTDVVANGGVLSVNAGGYDADEGELTRAWTAYDAEGFVLATSGDYMFVPPPGTEAVTVNVGSLRTVTVEPALLAPLGLAG